MVFSPPLYINRTGGYDKHLLHADRYITGFADRRNGSCKISMSSETEDPGSGYQVLK